MAPNFSAGDVVRMAVVWRFDGAADQVNVLHAILGPNVSTTDAGVLADIGLYVRAAYQFVLTEVCTLVTHDRIEVKNVTDNTVFGALPRDNNLDGAEAAQCLSPDTTALIVFRTLLSRVSGRIYLPTFSEAQQSGGELITASTDNMADMADFLMTTQNMVNGTDITYAVHSVSGVTRVPISYRVIANTRKQARRQVGRGS